MPEGLKPLLELAITAAAVSAMILLFKLGAGYLPSNGYPGGAKALIQAI